MWARHKRNVGRGVVSLTDRDDTSGAGSAGSQIFRTNDGTTVDRRLYPCSSDLHGIVTATAYSSTPTPLPRLYERSAHTAIFGVGQYAATRTNYVV
ncbi:uncharacterized protein B0I36DRAFT_324189, partial [Microdochium trichocladiopsis]